MLGQIQIRMQIKKEQTHMELMLKDKPVINFLADTFVIKEIARKDLLPLQLMEKVMEYPSDSM